MTAASKKWLLVLVSASLSIFAAFGFYDSFGPDSFVFRKELRRGNQIISKIEAFHLQRGRFPASMQEISISFPDSERFFYQQCADQRFIVWFGTRLGESMTYDSTLKTWQSLNISCGNARAGSEPRETPR
jgi:hypothetical protein